MDFQAIAKQFLDHYYQTMSNNRAEALNFFTNDSCMTYEGDSFKGVAKIKDKLEAMGTASIKYQFDEYDLQPGPQANSLLILVIGAMKVDNDPPFQFCQTFQLCPNGKGGFYLHNDVMRLIYPPTTN